MNTRTYPKKDLNIDTVVLFNNYTDDLLPEDENNLNNYKQKINKIEEKQNSNRSDMNALNVQTFETITAYDLYKKEIPPLEWYIENILPAGAALLVAPPKTNKSWFALAAGIKIAKGESFFRIQNGKIRRIVFSIRGWGKKTPR